MIGYRARWVFPVISPPIADGVVTIDEATGRVVAVGKRAEGEQVHDLGTAAIIPALINAHTHLEFSSLAQPLGRPGIGFADWIRAVIEYRRGLASAGEELSHRTAAIKQGLAESHQTGIAAIGEIAGPGMAPEVYENAQLQTVHFLELLGLSPERQASIVELAPKHLATESNPHSVVVAGLSPHAPYTVSPALVQTACQLSREHAAPLAMHLAESWDEIELLQSHSGPLVALLTELGAWYPGIIPRGIEARQYLEWLSDAHRALVIHGNFLQPEDWQFLAERSDRMSLVHCPRTHAFFGRNRFPLREILDANVCVAIGTDSRASNPDLSVFAELQWLFAQHADVSGEEILRMGTTEAAAALGLGSLGTLNPGGPAAVAPNADESLQDPYEFLFSAQTIRLLR